MRSPSRRTRNWPPGRISAITPSSSRASSLAMRLLVSDRDLRVVSAPPGREDRVDRRGAPARTSRPGERLLLGRPQVDGRLASGLVVALDVVADLLALDEPPQAGALDGGDVHEDVTAAGIRL